VSSVGVDIRYIKWNRDRVRRSMRRYDIEGGLNAPESGITHLSCYSRESI